MNRRVLLGAFGLLIIFAGPAAYACQLCLGGVLFAPGQQLDVAEQAVLATPMAGGTRWRIIGVAKRQRRRRPGHCRAGGQGGRCGDSGRQVPAPPAPRAVAALVPGGRDRRRVRGLAAAAGRHRPGDGQVRRRLACPRRRCGAVSGESGTARREHRIRRDRARAIRRPALTQAATICGDHRPMARRPQARRPPPGIHASARHRGRAGGRGGPRAAPRRGVGVAGRDQPRRHARGRPRAAC